jgi:hypothetical protein
MIPQNYGLKAFVKIVVLKVKQQSNIIENKAKKLKKR